MRTNQIEIAFDQCSKSDGRRAVCGYMSHQILQGLGEKQGRMLQVHGKGVNTPILIWLDEPIEVKHREPRAPF